ncbi:NADPH-dependent F420 reductase [Nesterenkonia sphaerica]|uniref:Diguanylate cyclase n=1 Tax=Nesterenkonia sphaerica TaxID=1804988 RepID=A0A5R9ACI9_9MICC|nr:NADPH-dependent F420 reductase [Nesterenkonia sphaerica]TLP75745.1 diguanylate cyclase [Nesterenkonia sphaerica]
MTTFTIFGTGSMATAIASVLTKGGATVEHIGSQDKDAAVNGSVAILAVPYPALADISQQYGEKLAGKVVVDISNPLNFETFDSLVVPADGSAAAELAAALPSSTVLKAFNTNFAATLTDQSVGPNRTTVMVAGDDEAAKQQLVAAVQAGGLKAVDAGALKRARELESLGFVQLTLAAGEKIPWNAGFALVH